MDILTDEIGDIYDYRYDNIYYGKLNEFVKSNHDEILWEIASNYKEGIEMFCAIEEEHFYRMQAQHRNTGYDDLYSHKFEFNPSHAENYTKILLTKKGFVITVWNVMAYHLSELINYINNSHSNSIVIDHGENPKIHFNLKDITNYVKLRDIYKIEKYKNMQIHDKEILFIKKIQFSVDGLIFTERNFRSYYYEFYIKFEKILKLEDEEIKKYFNKIYYFWPSDGPYVAEFRENYNSCYMYMYLTYIWLKSEKFRIGDVSEKEKEKFDNCYEEIKIYINRIFGNEFDNNKLNKFENLVSKTKLFSEKYSILCNLSQTESDLQSKISDLQSKISKSLTELNDVKQNILKSENQLLNIKKKIVESDNNIGLCSICQVNHSDILFMGCNHLCVCEKCHIEMLSKDDPHSSAHPNMDDLIKCPICRKAHNGNEIIKVYLT